MVLFGWPVLGMLIEVYGIIALFAYADRPPFPPLPLCINQ
jgi:hypothetical protein